MIWHEVNDYFHAAVVGTLHECFEFLHAVGHVDSEVGINVVVVLYGIWRTGIAFDDMWIVGTYAVAFVVGFCGVFNYSCIPDVSDSHVGLGVEHRFGYVVQFSAAVLLDGAVGHTVGVHVGEQTGENLIDDKFVVHIILTICRLVLYFQ